MATWDTKAWSDWSVIVDESGAGSDVACDLTAFDRVAGPTGNDVGLAWSPAPDCATPHDLNVHGAIVHVSE